MVRKRSEMLGAANDQATPWAEITKSIREICATERQLGVRPFARDLLTRAGVATLRVRGR